MQSYRELCIGAEKLCRKSVSGESLTIAIRQGYSVLTSLTCKEIILKRATIESPERLQSLTRFAMAVVDTSGSIALHRN